MFVGHYGVSFAAKRLNPSIPLWVLFVAVQLLDVIWGPLVALGIEKVRIVPGFTATNPLDLYYMPYTHSLVAAVLWSAGALVAYRWLAKPGPAGRAALIVGLAVFSHWVLDLVMHRPDLPLYDNTAKVGLGLWNYRAVALTLEIATLLAGLWLYARSANARPVRMAVFCLVLIGIHVLSLVGPVPPSDKALGWTALVGYVVLAATAWLLERTRGRAAPSGASAS